MLRALAFLTILFTSLAPRIAAAATLCIQIDPAKDNLSEGERAAAKTLLWQAFASEGQTVVEQGCEETYTAYHVRLGASLHLFLSGPKGSREAQARAIEELPPLYKQVARSILTGKALSQTNDTVDRHNVTAAQAVPLRVQADSLWYLRLGYGGMLGDVKAAGPHFGVGYRYELDSFGIDISAFNFMVATDNRTSANVQGSWIKLMGLYFLSPISNHSLYMGAGLSWGFATIHDAMGRFTGSGLQGELSVGYEFLRASTIRLFVQADAALPFFDIDRDFRATGVADGSLYQPFLGFSLGLAWGGNKTQTVRVVQ